MDNTSSFARFQLKSENKQNSNCLGYRLRTPGSGVMCSDIDGTKITSNLNWWLCLHVSVSGRVAPSSADITSD